jgi:hypothetical protein
VTKLDTRARPLRCPNPPKPQRCPLCGGSYVCLQPWRKRRTFKLRIAARKADPYYHPPYLGRTRTR